MFYSARPPGGCLIGGLNKDATLLMSHRHNEHVKAKFESLSVSDRGSSGFPCPDTQKQQTMKDTTQRDLE